MPIHSMRLGVDVRKEVEMNDGAFKLVVSAGSVLDFEGDAIVNAANQGCLGGGGVDGAITSAGGKELAAARARLPIVEGTRGVRCPTGEARVTTAGGRLHSRYVIHAVGPNYRVWSGTGQLQEDADVALYNAYRMSMLMAEENEMKTVGFSLLSAGIFRGARALDTVLLIGLVAASQCGYDGLKEVHFVGFLDAEVDSLETGTDALLEALSTATLESLLEKHNLVHLLAAPMQDSRAAPSQAGNDAGGPARSGSDSNGGGEELAVAIPARLKREHEAKVAKEADNVKVEL